MNAKQVGPYNANDYRSTMPYNLMAKMPPDTEAWFQVMKNRVLEQMQIDDFGVSMLTIDIRLPIEVLDSETMRTQVIDRASEEISYQARERRLMVVTVPRAWFWATRDDFAMSEVSGRVASVTVPQWAP